jgi:hypothetical protein
MRKENSKYVERDGPIRDNDKCSMTCAEYAEGGASLNFYFDGDVCECVDPNPADPVFNSQGKPPGSGYANLGACCNDHPKAGGCDQCPSGGGGASCPQGLKYPTVPSPFGHFRCCKGEMAAVQSCSEDDNGDALCAIYELAQSTNQCQSDEVNTSKDPSHPNMTQIKVCPEDVPHGFQNLLSCAGPPPPIRNYCKSDSDCDTGYSCHRNKCKKSHGGKKGKKPKPSPSPSPGPSPNPFGQGDNKGGMSGGEITGIVVGSVAGAILLLLAVGALLRGSGKKGKKK